MLLYGHCTREEEEPRINADDADQTEDRESEFSLLVLTRVIGVYPRLLFFACPQLLCLFFSPSRKPSSCRLRTGCCSLRTAFASIWRTRSRVTLKMRPTSSRV